MRLGDQRAGLLTHRSLLSVAQPPVGGSHQIWKVKQGQGSQEKLWELTEAKGLAFTTKVLKTEGRRPQEKMEMAHTMSQEKWSSLEPKHTPVEFLNRGKRKSHGHPSRERKTPSLQQTTQPPSDFIGTHDARGHCKESHQSPQGKEVGLRIIIPSSVVLQMCRQWEDTPTKKGYKTVSTHKSLLKE